jgi:hypothetical protein
MRMLRGRMTMEVRSRLMVACTLAAAALVQPETADACSGPPPPKPHELVERATAIIHVKVLGLCSELTGPCVQLSVASSPTPPTAEPYAPGWPPIMPPRAPNLYMPGASYTLLAVEVIEVLKGPPVGGRFAIRGTLVANDDYNDRDPPYDYVRKGGRTGSCHAYTYRHDAEYLLFLRGANDVLTPYWSAHAPVNEQVSSTHDPWITWVREQLAGK